MQGKVGVEEQSPVAATRTVQRIGSVGEIDVLMDHKRVSIVQCKDIVLSNIGTHFYLVLCRWIPPSHYNTINLHSLIFSKT